MCMCVHAHLHVSLCECACLCRCPQRPKGGIRCPGGCLEQLGMGAGNQTRFSARTSALLTTKPSASHQPHMGTFKEGHCKLSLKLWYLGCFVLDYVIHRTMTSKGHTNANIRKHTNQTEVSLERSIFLSKLQIQ